ncbi:hypothetical protein TVAG_388130 [Trichomonas vaginalis G3]|uniref:receptor protein-tyrosine kinase n=1 Tax=Trichomonas vaginalis (strain ATCC PRA-98 / G3) TaxID=412133 RepID=A2E139_TRIV3|nr:serine-type endopeptidase protein [Trichomonas vaginalis G3]EAY13671.1 hypothetical protein TVAG_388130 [Trichomonas vaginalis G3]KAI5529946.1 serine-type endopeptidase protein [Trichomonas vaginalis G3]|eukprot:XP_001325894.1 hypothetical protein [Trichomonas vaginalis G3]
MTLLYSMKWLAGEHNVYLYPGTYTFTAKGGSGGNYTRSNYDSPAPGKGALITGTYTFESNSKSEFRIVVGSDASGNTAGTPDGGKGAVFTTSGITVTAGSGGGSSRISLNGNPIIVAAGGSGAGYRAIGAPGGCSDTVYHVIYTNYNYNLEAATASPSNTVECSSNEKDGRAQNPPGSGGGGGDLCGKGGIEPNTNDYAPKVGFGGKSYMINGFSCNQVMKQNQVQALYKSLLFHVIHHAKSVTQTNNVLNVQMAKSYLMEYALIIVHQVHRM